MIDAAKSIGRKKAGLVAGWGRYPLVVAQALAEQGYETYCLGIKDHADPSLERLCDSFQWVGLAKLGAAIAGSTRQGGMTSTVIDVITSNEAVHENADVALGVTLTPLSTTLEKLLPSQAKVRQP